MGHAPDTFAVRLIKAQNRAGLATNVVAQLTGINPSSVSMFRTGKIVDVHGTTLVKLCRALNCSADYLLGLSEDPGVKAA